MKAKAVVAMWWDVPRDAQREWEDWHTTEHMPERLALPGMLRGTRCIAVSGEPSYFVFYEAAELSTLTSGPYVERLNNPTPWSLRMMPNHRNMVRSLCLVRASYGDGVAHAVATIRFSPGKDLPQLPSRKGVTSAHLLQAQAQPHAQTTEQKIRGGDATADWALLVAGYDARAVEQAAAEVSYPDAVRGLYRVSYSLAKP